MKTYQIQITVAGFLTLSSCGKILNSHAKSDAEPGMPGFFLANAVFVDGTEACDGNVGAAIKFEAFQEFRFPDPDNTLSGMDYAACTNAPSKQITKDEAPLAEGSAVSEVVDNTKEEDSQPPPEDNAKKFLSLCDEQTNGNKGDTFKAIGNALGITGIGSPAPHQGATSANTITQSDPTVADIFLDAAAPVSKDEVTEAKPPSDEAREIPSKTYSDYCQRLYDSAKAVTSLDLKNANISDLRPLKYLTSIRKLDLSGNPIQSAASISTMQLDWVGLENIPLTAITTIYKWK